ncbi:uncharacterized protein LOC124276535 [Haliotis rubra]|uniref:uncharacterized protein LOC124276535 n=1 Tax=Haliotis rubra TaxID=36100 RepID=UPI001EE598DF|nr:uncharacterized protein LOC124276535 [Haliotis rubra]
MATGGENDDTEVDAVLDTSSDVQNETEHYDVALLFAENDKNQALEILEQMEEITVENGEKPKVCLYTDLPGASAHTEAGRNLTKVATLILVLATENLQDEEVAKLIKDEAIGNTRLASKCHPGLKYCVRPLYLDKERKAHPPGGLSTIQEVRWYDKDSRCGQRDIRMLLQNHLQYRNKREREDSRQRVTVRDTRGSRPPKDSTDNINLAVSIAVRQAAMGHREQEVMATPAPEVGHQSFDSTNLQRPNNINGSSIQSRSTNESSDARAPGQSESERNNHQPSDSTMAQGVALPRVVHYHTHYHGEGPGLSQGGPPQRGLPGAPRYPGHPAAPPPQNPQQRGPVNMSQQSHINIVNCENVQVGSNTKMIIGGQRERMTERDNEAPYDSPTSAAPNQEDSPPPYSQHNPSSPASTERKTPWTHVSSIPSQAEPRGDNPACGGQEAGIVDVSQPGSESLGNASGLSHDGPRSSFSSERMASEGRQVQTGLTDLQPHSESTSGLSDFTSHTVPELSSPSAFLEMVQSELSEDRDSSLKDERKKTSK